MLPHKTVRGHKALLKMKAFEGMPAPYDKTTKLGLPSANRHLALKPRRKHCTGEFRENAFGARTI